MLLLCVAAAGLAVPGCGKKGPPLAPLARVPGRAMDIAARRTGDAVAITFTVPSANVDESKPADIGRADVYAYTAMAQNDVRDPRRMTLAGSVPVRKPLEPGAEDATAKKPGPPPPREPGARPGRPGHGDRDVDRRDARAAGARPQRARARAGRAGVVVWHATGAAAGRTGSDARGAPLLRGLRLQPRRRPRRRVAAAVRAARPTASAAAAAASGGDGRRRAGALDRAARGAPAVPGAGRGRRTRSRPAGHGIRAVR